MKNCMQIFQSKNQILIIKNNLNVEFTDGIESNYQINDLISEINKNLTTKKIYLKEEYK